MARSKAAKALERLGLDFEVSVAQGLAAEHPGDLDALRGLAYAYTAAARHEEALEVDRRLVALDPSRADLRYDLACSLALTGRKEEALAELARAADLGFDDRAHLLADEDLASLRDDPRFRAIAARVPEQPVEEDGGDEDAGEQA